MKTHTNGFKNAIKLFGRELDSKITYTLNNTTITLTSEDLNSVTPRYEGSILKSVMKELEIDSNVNIAVNTEINYKFGVKVGNTYEYIDYGNYIVYKSEKQEDTGSYKIICYDKLLYSMKAYEDLNITYPITIRNYINAICTKLGLTFSNLNGVFANYDKQIQNELYLNTEGNSIGYTYRDVLDELAQVTASTICINNNDELEIRYITETNDTIDEEYLKNINVNMGEQYGPINTIVLSRSGGADNIYYPEVLPANPIEIKITDNQIMNGNDRYQYMPDIYNKLNGLQYYINDFASTGICYYDLCDRYTISIGNNSYSCVMLNDEVLVTQGLEENIHTNLLEESVTEYKYADTTDRRINQTNLIVDKQNQIIQGLITKQEDLLRTRTGNTTLTIDDCAEGYLLRLRIIGNNSVFDGLVPSNTLVPNNTLVPMGDSRIVITNGDNVQIYELGITGVLRANANTYDEYILDNNSAKVIRRVNADGTTKSTPTIEDLGEFQIDILEGTNTISIKNYSAKIEVDYAVKSAYTEKFATKVELSSSINQSATSIKAEVNQTLTNYSTTTQMNSAIQIKADEISSVVATKVGENEVISKINQTSEQVQINANKISLARKNNTNDI